MWKYSILLVIISQALSADVQDADQAKNKAGNINAAQLYKLAKLAGLFNVDPSPKAEKLTTNLKQPTNSLASSQENMTTNKKKFEKNQGKIEKNKGKIDKNQRKFEKNQEKIDKNQTKIEKNERKIEKNEKNIEKNQGKIKKNQEKMETNQDTTDSGSIGMKRDAGWRSYKSNFRKRYSSKDHETRCYRNYQKNVDIIQKHNERYRKGLATYYMGTTPYSDLSFEQFKTLLGIHSRNVTTRGKGKEPVNKVVTVTCSSSPLASQDWRTSGIITGVKDQGQCGSCWAFSVTGAIESAQAKATGSLVSLSEQNLMDCSTSYGNKGCNGGWMPNAFQYVIDKNGINTEASYPYKAKKRKCSFKAKNIGARISSYAEIKSNDEDQLVAALTCIGPVSIAFSVVQSFQNYVGGVYDETNCDSLNHAMLAVGYVTNTNPQYYYVKNSWGTGWGESGYVRIKKGSNICGIATASSYPIV